MYLLCTSKNTRRLNSDEVEAHKCPGREQETGREWRKSRKKGGEGRGGPDIALEETSTMGNGTTALTSTWLLGPSTVLLYLILTLNNSQTKQSKIQIPELLIK